MNTSYVFSFGISELELESLGFQAVIAVLVESVFDGGAGTVPGGSVIYLGEHAEMLHLIGEVPAVEFHFKDGLIQVLELGESEDLRHQLETDRFEMNILTQAGACHPKYLVMIECQ